MRLDTPLGVLTAPQGVTCIELRLTLRRISTKNGGMSKPSINPLVAEEIRVLLARRRWSASDLARKTGMTQRAISRRLTGEKVIDVDDLVLFAEAFGVELASLLPREDRAVVGTRNQGGQPTVAYSGQPEWPQPISRGPRSSSRRPSDNRPGGRPDVRPSTHVVQRLHRPVTRSTSRD